MHRILHAAIGLAVAAVVSCPARAAVADSTANGFSITETVHVAAPPDKVYAALIVPAHWWSATHSFSKDAANFTLEAHAGGCWCEKLPDGGSVEHMTVFLAAPGKALVLRGALGPLQGLGVDGALTVKLTAAGDGTDVSATYNVGGYLKDGLASWAAPVDQVLAEQFERLKQLLETGSPDTEPLKGAQP